MNFTPPITAKLRDDDAEQIRRVTDTQIAELQRAVRAIVSERERPALWQLIERIELESAATTVAFENLSGDSDVEYLLRGRVIDESNTASAIALRPNGETSTFRTQSIRGSATTATASTNTVLYVGRTLAEDGVSTFEGTFFAKTGSLRVWQGVCSANETTTPTTVAEVRTGYWTNTTDEITSLVIVSPATGGFGIGSEFALYRRAPWP